MRRHMLMIVVGEVPVKFPHLSTLFSFVCFKAQEGFKGSKRCLAEFVGFSHH